MLISSLSPQRRSDCKASGELFTAVDKEREGSLCSCLGTALPVRWCLALLAGIRPTLPPRSFTVLEALATRPETCLQDWLAPMWNLGSKVGDELPFAAQLLQVLLKSHHCLAQNPYYGPRWISGSSPKSHLAGSNLPLPAPSASVPSRASHSGNLGFI